MYCFLPLSALGVLEHSERGTDLCRSWGGLGSVSELQALTRITVTAAWGGKRWGCLIGSKSPGVHSWVTDMEKVLTDASFWLHFTLDHF